MFWINVVKLHDGELVDGGRQFLTLFEKKSGASRRSLAHKTAASVLSREQLLFRALRLVTTLFCHNAEVTCEAIHKLSHYSIWPGGRGRVQLDPTEKVEFQATKMALKSVLSAVRQQNKNSLLNFGQIRSVNLQGAIHKRCQQFLTPSPQYRQFFSAIIWQF